MKNKIMVSDICKAFNDKAVGSKILLNFRANFWLELDKAIEAHDFSTGLVKGQAVIDLPKKVNDWVSAGTWKRGSKDPKDYVLRQYRGEVGMYLKRRPEMKSVRVRCVVYTTDAYKKDPDFTKDEARQLKKFFGKEEGYVLVAVLGDPDRNLSTVSYSRFVKNLAGANNEYKVMSKDEVVALAQKVVDYRSKYMGVAD
jgi:hypothetical protein